MISHHGLPQMRQGRSVRVIVTDIPKEKLLDSRCMAVPLLIGCSLPLAWHAPRSRWALQRQTVFEDSVTAGYYCRRSKMTAKSRCVQADNVELIHHER